MKKTPATRTPRTMRKPTPRPISAKARIAAAGKAIEDAKVTQAEAEAAQAKLKDLTPEERAAAELKARADEAADHVADDE